MYNVKSLIKIVRYTGVVGSLRGPYRTTVLKKFYDIQSKNWYYPERGFENTLISSSQTFSYPYTLNSVRCIY